MTTDLEHVPDFPSQLLEAHLEEWSIPVAGYVRTGKHGLVRVSHHTRDLAGFARYAAGSNVKKAHQRAQAGVKTRRSLMSARYEKMRDDADLRAMTKQRYPNLGPVPVRIARDLAGTAGQKIRDVPNRTLDNLKARRPADGFRSRGADPSVGRSRKSGRLTDNGGTGRLRDAPPRHLTDERKRVAKRLADAGASAAVKGAMRGMPSGQQVAQMADLLDRLNPPKTPTKARRRALVRDLLQVYTTLHQGDIGGAKRQMSAFRQRFNIKNLPKTRLS